MIRQTLRPVAHALRSVMGTHGIADRLAALELRTQQPGASVPAALPVPPAPPAEKTDHRKGFQSGTLADLDAVNQKHQKSPLRERLNGVGRFLLAVESLPLDGMTDPFSDEYRNKVRESWSIISGRDGYDPLRDELAPYLDPKAAVLNPAFYASGDSRYVGEVMSGIGFILQKMDVRKGDSVLEYGAGEGQIAITLARTGCEVAVIDVEQRYLDGITLQAQSIGAKIAVQQGVFGDAFGDGQRFDRILFFEAFHHALEHQEVLRKLHAYLKPGGRVVLACEAVIFADTPWESVVPYAWGPRLDGLSVNAMRVYGWCELGFRDDYFAELLMRTGYLCEFHQCPATDFGSSHVARPHGGVVEMGDSFLIKVWGRDAGWHEPEAGLRWTKAHAILPLDSMLCRAGIAVCFFNFLPIARQVTIRLGDSVHVVSFAGGEERVLRLEVPDDAVWLEIMTTPEPIGAYLPTPDHRMVGIAVRSVTYLGPT
jgi:2-polyprenyl-3-methyl-5-hydroxy-6-metoxy-1,4-benzoquinol methylase